MTLFLSYSTKDEATVRGVAKYIPKEMIDVWIDHKKIGGGRDLKKAIQNGIKNADVFFLFISKEALSSDWVKKELALAKKKEKELKYEFIVPVVLEQEAWESWKEKELKARKYIEFDGNIDKMAHEIKDTIVNKTIEKYEYQCLLKRDLLNNIGGGIAVIISIVAFFTEPTETEHINHLTEKSIHCNINNIKYTDRHVLSYATCPTSQDKELFSLGVFGIILSKEMERR